MALSLVWFARAMPFQTPSSVSSLALTEFRGENSVSSSQPIICVPRRTHRVFRRTHRVCCKTQCGSVSSLLRNSTLKTVFRPFLESATTIPSPVAIARLSYAHCVCPSHQGTHEGQGNIVSGFATTSQTCVELLAISPSCSLPRKVCQSRME